MKFLVKTWESKWYNCEYVVEANSAEDIKGLTYEELQENFKLENFNSVDDYDILSIEPYEN